MQFNSYIFILLFLPIMIIGYFGLNKLNTALGKVFLVIACAGFYLYGGVGIAIVLGISIIVNYICAIGLHRFKNWKYKKLILVAAIICNIASLFYYKYFNFLLSSLNSVLENDFTLREIALPLGISFFTFQQIMYLVNVHNEKINELSLIDYLAYILYFPKLIMGPLMEPTDFISQINDSALKKMDWDNVACGLKTFSYGLFKKLILADTFAAAVTWGFSNIESATSMDLILVMLAYTFEIYFDFSGYSDMAVGVSLMLNIKLPMNFNSPYKALSIADFWKRWHMSLTGFFTRYIYIPLGGNRKGTVRTYINILIVFLVSGFWHGANWTFVLWGVLHGVFNSLDKAFGKAQAKIMEAVRWFTTFSIINMLWLLFRSDSITQWKDLLVKMFTFNNTRVSKGLLETFVLPESSFLFNLLHLDGLNEAIRGFSMLLFLTGAFIICLIPDNNYNKLKHNTIITMLLAAVAFVWSFLCLSSESVFVYFNF